VVQSRKQWNLSQQP